MATFQNIPAPSGQLEVLLVEVSTPSSQIRAKLKEEAQNLCRQQGQAEAKRSAALVYVECPISSRQKELEDNRRDGCISELFVLTTRARELGWNRVLVVDNLTKRQTSGETDLIRRWERASEVTVVSISIGTSMQETPFARRMPLSIAIKTACDADAEIENGGEGENEMKAFESGFMIHDPDGRLFTAPTKSFKEEQTKVANELTSAGMPLEISNMISDYAYEEPTVEEMISVPQDKADSSALIFQSITPASDSIIEAAQKTLAELLYRYNGNQQKTCKITSWKLRGAATRRNLFKLYERILNGESKANIGRYDADLLMWDAELWLDSRHHELLFMYYEHDCVHARAVKAQEALRLIALNDREEWLRQAEPRIHDEESKCRDVQAQLKEKMIEECRAAEVLQDPNQRFFYDPPDVAPSGYEGNPTVYFLTKHLDDDDIRRIKHELIEVDDGYDIGDPKEFEFVPWTKEEDGTPEDVARIHKLCHQNWRRWRCSEEQIFIDRQSARDLTVIIADTWFSKNASRYLGVQFGRLAGREAHIAWANLSISNMDIEEFVEEGDDLNKLKDLDNPESDSESSSQDEGDDEDGDDDDETEEPEEG